jgi:uncharacterized protein (TIGR02284 family)
LAQALLLNGSEITILKATRELLMSSETKVNLKPETVENLQDLIQANIDAFDGLREAAEEIDDISISTLFRDIALERSNFASELQDFVAWNGEEAIGEGTFAAAVHRAWINVRSKLNSGDPYVVLVEAEFGEDHIKEAYEESLRQTAGSEINTLLQRQYVRIKAGHDRIRDLRDLYANRK